MSYLPDVLSQSWRLGDVDPDLLTTILRRLHQQCVLHLHHCVCATRDRRASVDTHTVTGRQGLLGLWTDHEHEQNFCGNDRPEYQAKNTVPF